MNWLHRFLPSHTADHDPARVTCEQPGITPVTLENLKLISPIRRRFDDHRRSGIEVTCPKPKHLGVVVPYRNREQHLEAFLPHMHAFLDEAGIRHTIIIAEQADDLPFNRGAMRNIGTMAAWDLCDHFVWNDVDLLPQTAAYLAYSQPTKLVRTIRFDDGEVQELFNHNFGGVLSIGKKHLELTNGMSNRYWGWGLEDDDFLLRCLFVGLHPCKDDAGIFRGLIHAPSVSTEHTDFASASARKKQRQRSRAYFSQVKRDGANFAADGLNQIKRQFQIVQPSSGELHVKAKLIECLNQNAQPPIH